MGLVAACLTFIYRISSLSRAEAVNVNDFAPASPAPSGLAAYRLYGALFFGAVKLVEDLMDQLPQRVLVLDLKNVIYIDSSGADVLADLARACVRAQVRLILCGLAHQPLDIARRCGLTAQLGPEQIQPDLATAIAAAA